MPPNTSDDDCAIIIINDIAPYIYEINNILCLPKDFRYRVRYRNYEQRWMPEVDNPAELGGCDALIVLREKETSFLYPIRKVKINNVETIGDIIYIEFINKEIVDISSNESSRNIETFHKELEAKIAEDGWENRPGEDLNSLIFFTEDDYTVNLSGNHRNEIGRWGELVGILATGLDKYRDFDFIKIHDISAESGGTAEIVNRKDARGAKYELNDKTTYDIRVVQRTRTHVQDESMVIVPRTLRLETGPEIENLISKLTISGKYDIMRFKIRPDIDNWEGNSFLRLVFDREKLNRQYHFDDNKFQQQELPLDLDSGNSYDAVDNIPREDLIPSIEIPISIRKTTQQRNYSIFLSVLFGIVAVLIFVPDLLVFWMANPSSGLVQNIQNGLVVVLIIMSASLKDFQSYITSIFGSV